MGFNRCSGTLSVLLVANWVLLVLLVYSTSRPHYSETLNSIVPIVFILVMIVVVIVVIAIAILIVIVIDLCLERIETTRIFGSVSEEVEPFYEYLASTSIIKMPTYIANDEIYEGTYSTYLQCWYFIFLMPTIFCLVIVIVIVIVIVFTLLCLFHACIVFYCIFIALVLLHCHCIYREF